VGKGLTKLRAKTRQILEDVRKRREEKRDFRDSVKKIETEAYQRAYKVEAKEEAIRRAQRDAKKGRGGGLSVGGVLKALQGLGDIDFMDMSDLEGLGLPGTQRKKSRKKKSKKKKKSRKGR